MRSHIGRWPKLAILLLLLTAVWGSYLCKPGDRLDSALSATQERATSFAELTLPEGPAVRVGEAALPGPSRAGVPKVALAGAPGKFSIATPRTPSEQAQGKRPPPSVEIHDLTAGPPGKAKRPTPPPLSHWVQGMQTVIQGQPLLCKDNPHDRTLTAEQIFDPHPR